jgi:HK97 family phage major capsid protein
MNVKELKETIEKLNREFGEFKGVLEGRAAEEQRKFGETLGETKAKLDAINTRIDQLDVKVQRHQVTAPDRAEESQKDREYRAAFNKHFRKGEKGLSEIELKALATDSDPDGGYFLPRNVRAGIIEKLVEVSPVRELATIETIGVGDSLDVPKEGSTTFEDGWVSERQDRPETGTGQFALDQIPTFEQYAKPRATQKMLDDVAFDVEGWISRKVQQRFGKREGTAFVSGNGVTQPEGLLTNADIVAVNSGDANLLTPDGVISLYYELPEPYAVNATWLMRRGTVKSIRLFKDQNDQYLWQPAMSDKTPSTILGQPYREAIDMPAIAAGNFPIIFGDFKAGYVIVDRQGIRVLRDPYSAKPFVEFYTTRRVGGQVVLAEAFVKQKVSA